LKATAYVEDQTVYNIQYWEIPGYLKNMNYFFRYCLGSTAAIFVFDLTKKSSLEKIESWITETNQCEIPTRYLVGSKLDQFDASKQGIDRNLGREIANKHNLQYFEVSSIAEGGLNELFQNLFTSMKNLIPNPPKPESLLGKGVVLGKKLLTSQKYQLVDSHSTRPSATSPPSTSKIE